MKEKLIFGGVALCVAIVVAGFVLLNGKKEPPVQASDSGVQEEGRVVQALQPGGSMNTVSAQDIEAAALATALSQGRPLMLVDVREPSEFSEGHIKGAKNIPLGEVEARLGEIPKDQDVVLICRSGRRSLSALEKLKSAGYSRLQNFKGGMLTWQGEVEK